MRRLTAVDRDAHAVHARGFGLLRAFGVHATATSGHRGRNAKALELAYDVQPILPQVRFTADERRFAHAELGHLPHQIQTLRGAQLTTAFVPRARAAMPAGQIALEGDLPDCVNGARSFIDRTRARCERQLTTRRRCVGRDRQLSRSRAQHLLRPFLRRHRIASSHLSNISRLAPP